MPDLQSTLRFAQQRAVLKVAKHLRQCQVLLFCVTAFAIAPAFSWVIDDTSSLTLKDNEQYGAGQKQVSLTVVDVADSIPLGAIGCVGVCLGLEAEAGGHAKVDLNFGVGFTNSIDLLAKANTRTFIFGADTEPEVGSSFFLVNRIESPGIEKLNLNAGNFWASSSLGINIGAWAKAEACLALCIKGNFSVKTIFDPLLLAGVSNSGLTLLGSNVDSSPPYSYTEPTGLYGGSANIPNFSKTFTNITTSKAANLPAQQQQLVGVWVDVAEVIARAFGLTLSGSALGFDYELLSLDLFAGMNLQHSFKLNILDVETYYSFSSPVQIFDSITHSWGAPVSSLVLGDYESVQLRAEDAGSLGIVRIPRYVYEIDWGYDLILNAGAELDAIAVNGYGLNIGPLLNPDPWKVDLKKIHLGSKKETHVMVQQDNSLNIKFNPVKIFQGDPGGPVTEVNLCALLPEGCQQSGYVAVRTDLGGGIMEETVWRVFNYGVPGCNDHEIMDCDIDFDLLPQITRYRVNDLTEFFQVGIDLDEIPDNALLLAALQELGIDPNSTLPLAQIKEFANDFEAIDAFLLADPLVGGPASSDEELLAALTALGVNLDDPFPKQPLGPGAPKLTAPLTENQSVSVQFAVPEPPVVFLYLMGLLLIAGRGFFPQALQYR